MAPLLYSLCVFGSSFLLVFPDLLLILFRVLLNVHPPQKEDRHNKGQYIHSQIDKDQYILRSDRLFDKGRVIAGHSEQSADDSYCQSQKAHHNGTIDRHCETVASKAVFGFEVIKDIRDDCQHDILRGNDPDCLEHDARADHLEIVDSHESDGAAQY